MSKGSFLFCVLITLGKPYGWAAKISRLLVIGLLTKLQPGDLPFAIDNYHEQTDRIKNVKGYLLTLLYHARDQSHLDLMNLGHYNGDF